MTVIEFGLMGVKPNHDVMDPSTSPGQILKKAWDTVTVPPNGPQWVYGGLEIEDPSSLWGFFEFESVKQHEDFAKTFGVEAVKELPEILTHSEFQKHIEVEPSLRPVLQAPATEVMLTYFQSDISTAKKAEISHLVHEIVDLNLKTSPDLMAVSFGWSVENDFPVLGGEEGQVGAVLGLFIGWESVDPRKRSQEASSYGEYVEKIEKIVGVLKTASRFIKSSEFGRQEV